MNILSEIVHAITTTEERKVPVTNVGATEAQAQIQSDRLKDFIIIVQFVVIVYLFFA